MLISRHKLLTKCDPQLAKRGVADAVTHLIPERRVHGTGFEAGGWQETEDKMHFPILNSINAI